jgi:uncharacterized protein YbdZ (MbtH family)
MRTKEQIEQEISYFERSLRYHRVVIEQQGKIIEENNTVVLRDEKRIDELKKELSELDEPKPVPDLWGNPPKFEFLGTGWTVTSREGERAECIGPTRATKQEAAEDWRKMMTDPDKPRVVEKDGKRFAVFPTRVEIPDDVSVVAVAVDMCGYPCIYRSDPHFDGIEWISGSISRGRVSIKNASDMIVKVPK